MFRRIRTERRCSALIQYRNPQNYDIVLEALKKAGRMDLVGYDNTVCCVQNGTVGRIREHPIVRAVRRSGEIAPDHNASGSGNAFSRKHRIEEKAIRNIHKKRKANDPMKIAFMTELLLALAENLQD